MKTEQLKEILTKKFSPVYLEVLDHAEQHAEHQEAKISGGGHFIVTIVSDAFKDQSLLKRHQLVYEILRDQFSDIHALSIKALTVSEWKSRS